MASYPLTRPGNPGLRGYEQDGNHTSEPLLEDESCSEESCHHTQEGHAAGSRGYQWFRSMNFPRLQKERHRNLGRANRSILKSSIFASLLILAGLGITQLCLLVKSYMSHTKSTGIHDFIESWGHEGHPGAGLSSWPTSFSRGIVPKACHSHNDYWREVPLYSAIEAGCISVEADIWLHNEELYVGHSIPSLTANRTLETLYIDPLVQILQRQNSRPLIMPTPEKTLHGVFDTDSSVPMVLLIDFKTPGTLLWETVYTALKPLRSRGYLTHVNGSEVIAGVITVVGTGETPFDKVISETDNPHRDIFFDAPLSRMGSDFAVRDPSTNVYTSLTSRSQGAIGAPEDPDAFTDLNSYYASVSFKDAIGDLQHGALSDEQITRIRSQISGAHKRGLKARYWDLPSWPIGLRNHVWDVLTKEGIDILNVDDLKAATQLSWVTR